MSKSNLYTKGGEYRLPDGREYVGSYHIHPNKGPMVGALHSTKPHSFLFPYLNRIQSFEFDYSDLPPTSEKRSFSIVGDNGSEFKLEIKDNTTGKYYNFITNVFQTNQYSLEEKITNNRYDGTIKFTRKQNFKNKKNTEILTQRELKKKSLNKLSFCDRTAKEYLSDLDNILSTIKGHYILTLNKDGKFNSKFTHLVKYHRPMIFGNYPSTRLFSNKPFKRNCKEITDY